MAERLRTNDIEGDASSFRELILPEELLSALSSAGFKRPSPVQYEAIPLARLGADLIVQAKSGTGKTLVYAVAALESIDVETLTPQAVVLAPTREIALQSSEVITAIIDGLEQPMLKCGCFIGGQPTPDDEKRLRRACQIVVGTPGRLCALVESGSLPVDTVRMLVMDEADQLLAEVFKEDVAWLRDELWSEELQFIAVSATFTEEMLRELRSWMSDPQQVMLCEETVSLKGVKHFYSLLEEGEAADEADAEHEGPRAPHKALAKKVERLVHLMSSMTFHQAVVFCNQKSHGEWLANKLTAAAFPAVYISGGLPQEERTSAMRAIRGFKRRVLVSTDLTARGVDLEHINLVVNLDIPYEAPTLLHRIGRTGRWGTFGVAVTYCVGEEELRQLQGFIQEAGGGELQPLPDSIPEELYSYELVSEEDKFEFKQLLEAPILPDPDEVALLEEEEEEEEEEGDPSDMMGAHHCPAGGAWQHHHQHHHQQQQQQPAGTGGQQAAAPEGHRRQAATWEEYVRGCERYEVEHQAWVWSFYEWREQYRQWLYAHHMAAAQQAAAAP